MREIKFRAWDLRNEKMHDWEQIRGHWDIDALLGGLWEGFGGKKHPWNYPIPMQYTGLRDKNDIEIYESDAFIKIFRTVEIPTGKSGIEKAVGIVKLNEGAFQVHVEGWGYELLSDVLKSQNTNEHSDYWENEVIGNIHENPELLKGS